MQMAALALMVVLGSSLSNSIAAQPYNDYDQDRDVSYQTFYDELSPYGQWVEYPGQGYVWVPDAGENFQPYSTNGHWVWTDDYEWMWVSDYDWGWAPFHYGRWDHDPYYGWYWVPGYEWSPAWVAWRDGGDYYGWAPIRPGINISINFNIGGYNPPYDFWCFAPRRYITSPRIYDYYVDRRRNVTIINQTTIIINNYRYSNNYGFRSGPRRYDAEVYCGRINPVRFRQSATPGRTFYRNNEVSIYRPSIRQHNDRNLAPRNFERYDRTNGSIRNNSSNNGFRRDNSYGNRDNSINNRRPDTRDRVSDDRTFRRNDNNGRNDENGLRRYDNNRQTDRNRFDRNENALPDRQPADRRMERPQTNPGRTTDPGNRQTDNNRFDRRADDNPGRNRDVRTNDNRERNQPQPQFDRRQDTRPQQQLERRQDTRPQQQFEKRQDTRPQQQFERRQDTRPQQQMERRQESRQQPQQFERRQETRQQPQQFERRDAGRQGGGNNGSNNGNGRGRSRS